MRCAILALLILASPMHAARDFVRTSTHYLNNETQLVDVPFTVAMWFRTTDLANTQVLFSVTSMSSVNRAHYLIFRGATDDTLNADTEGDSAFGEAKSSGVVSSGVWAHCAAVWAAGNDRRVFLNGAKNTNASNAALTGGMVRTSIGRVWFVATAAPANGQLAEVGLWNVALSDEELVSLSKGISPLAVRSQNLVDYWPLVGNATNESGLRGAVMTNSGSTKSDLHPRIYR